MLEQIIFLVRFFPHNMEFHIGEYVFSGVRYLHGHHFPWHNRKSRNAFMENLSLLETPENDRIFKHWLSEWMLEQIHIRFSYALIMQVSAMALQLPAAVCLGLGNVLQGALISGVSALLYQVHLYLRKRVASLHTSLKFSLMLINTVMEQEYGTGGK
ncbi:MAG: hypothetical protein K9J30_08980 [Bacteroidales bacterium]|nr:hypothetical protein [Bacteroidales bacterium]